MLLPGSGTRSAVNTKCFRSEEGAQYQMLPRAMCKARVHHKGILSFERYVCSTAYTACVHTDPGTYQKREFFLRFVWILDEISRKIDRFWDHIGSKSIQISQNLKLALRSLSFLNPAQDTHTHNVMGLAADIGARVPP